MNWATLKAELRFKFEFQIQFSENLAKFTTATVFALYRHQRSRSKVYPSFKEIQVQMYANLKELIVSEYRKIIKYILVISPWVYDSCITTVYSHAMDFAFKAAIETGLTASAAAIP